MSGKKKPIRTSAPGPVRVTPAAPTAAELLAVLKAVALEAERFRESCSAVVNVEPGAGRVVLVAAAWVDYELRRLATLEGRKAPWFIRTGGGGGASPR